jgi:threonine synthase
MRCAVDAHIGSGIRVLQAIGDFLLRAVRERRLHPRSPMRRSAPRFDGSRREGRVMGREGAATYAAYRQGLADGRIGRHEEAVLFNCATGLKYPLPPVHRTLDRSKPIDFAAL